MLEEKGKPTETYATVNWWREQHVLLHQGSPLHKLRGCGQKRILSHQNNSVSVLDTFGPFLLIIHTLYCMLLSDQY